MAKRVICECPRCQHETIADKAALRRDPLVTCAACGATMEVDLPPPMPPAGSEEAASPKEPAEEEAPPESETPPRTSRSPIAKTMPMSAVGPAQPAPPLPPGAQRKPTARPSGTSPVLLLLVGAVCGAGGWLAASARADEPALRDYCAQHGRDAQATVQMCNQLLGDDW